MGRGIRIAGAVFVWLGIVLLLNSFIGVTGLAVSELGFIDSIRIFQPVFFVGIFFLVFGFLMMGSRSKR